MQSVTLVIPEALWSVDISVEGLRLFDSTVTSTRSEDGKMLTVFYTRPIETEIALLCVDIGIPVPTTLSNRWN